MCVCACVCVCVCVYAFPRVSEERERERIMANIYTHNHMPIYINISFSLSLFIFLSLSIYIYIYVCVCVCVCVYVGYNSQKKCKKSHNKLIYIYAWRYVLVYWSISSSLHLRFCIYICLDEGTSGGVMVSKLDSQTYTNEFESHWVPHSFDLVLNRSKDLRKLLIFA